MADVLRRWPLSGVLSDVVEAPIGPLEFGGHPGLMLLYAERLGDNDRPALATERSSPAWEYYELVDSGTLPVAAATSARLDCSRVGSYGEAGAAIMIKQARHDEVSTGPCDAAVKSVHGDMVHSRSIAHMFQGRSTDSEEFMTDDTVARLRREVVEPIKAALRGPRRDHRPDGSVA